ncbi:MULTISPECIES: dihydrofolate reductase [Chryseobacterium]|jgi:dihydrofolate reductase|uniref:Dihydrofolate reductase n=1 Tax=Chryseobacterium indoltheticum TaxID=254 RepID=A0A381F7Q4_9FLAO|nr:MULTISPECIES: dihydrofolate reductase [Chryseobacterium]AZA61334.1 dihydrofolate reductase [Chryseobacterium indoltheticum]AZA73007.1 dihydrofolate reductase [Chryseobacterium indoltheticum]MDQ8142004.1 dihydrofolate reductase [Chryseobacterium sp. CFS15]SIP91291.1 dihydrofolate reductase [Chryseobacterium indoltheticum]SUX42616.1 Dihydrofolate reductase type 3 [Chryseobacterium indoltheticum]
MTTIVVAMGEKNEIGSGNQLLWHLPKDLKHFKDLTSGHPIIMGRKTYESIGKALPNRTNIVVSRKKNWFQEGILIVGSIKEAVKFAKKIDENIFIIGGGNVYEQTMEIADRLEVTLVKANLEADTYFPKINDKIWKKTEETCHEKDEKNQYDFCFQTYEKVNG